MPTPITYPAYLNSPYYQFVAKTFHDALYYDAMSNPTGLPWLEAIFPHSEPHGEELRAYWGFREYTPVHPPDFTRSACYFIPIEPLTRLGGASWGFGWDIVFFVNLESIRPFLNAMPIGRGRYHAELMQNAIYAIDKKVWGFNKQLTAARLITEREIFAELPNLDPQYVTAPFAAFRLNYAIEIPEVCVPFFPFPEPVEP